MWLSQRLCSVLCPAQVDTEGAGDRSSTSEEHRETVAGVEGKTRMQCPGCPRRREFVRGEMARAEFFWRAGEEQSTHCTWQLVSLATLSQSTFRDRWGMAVHCRGQSGGWEAWVQSWQENQLQGEEVESRGRSSLQVMGQQPLPSASPLHPALSYAFLNSGVF